MPEIEIDGRTIDAPAGSSVLDACRRLGVDIPTLCHLEGHEHFTSCMLCVVENRKSGALIPSCSAPVAPGLSIATASAKVVEARQAALELLLSEHVGDCEGPCHRGCPAHMNIPLMIRQIKAGELRDAIVTVKRAIALPAALGRICPAPCEGPCRRKQIDAPVSICMLKRYVADADLASGSPFRPACASATGKRVAIVGAGPTGLAAAYYLRQMGHACTLFDEQARPGGALRSKVPEAELPRAVIDAETGAILSLGVEFRGGVRVGRDVSFDSLRGEYAACILAVGTVDEAGAKAFGVDAAKRGIKIQSGTFETSLKGVFAGGGAAGVGKLAVRSVADGREMAASVDLYLAGKPQADAAKSFNSVIGKIMDGERAELMAGVDAAPRAQRDKRAAEGFTAAEAATESARCVHCDCRKPESCALRRHCARYDAKQSHYKPAQRRPFECVREHADVLYEPGKCIKCSLCVRITAREGEKLGLTFIGRGFDVRIKVPFNHTLAEGLKVAAAKCVQACPTGALAFRAGEETWQPPAP